MSDAKTRITPPRPRRPEVPRPIALWTRPGGGHPARAAQVWVVAPLSNAGSRTAGDGDRLRPPGVTGKVPPPSSPPCWLCNHGG